MVRFSSKRLRIARLQCIKLNVTRLCGELILIENTGLHEAIFFIVVISLMMIFLISLISDLDNPFGHGDAMSVEDVSLDVLTSAVKRMKNVQ